MANLPRVSMLPDERYPIAVFPDEVPTVPQLPAQFPLPASPLSPSEKASMPVLSNDNSKSLPPTESVVATSPVSSLNSSIPVSSLNNSIPVSSLAGSMLSRTETATNSLSDEPPMYRGDPTIYKGEENWKVPAFDSELLRAPQQSTSFWRQFNVWKVLFFGVFAFVTGVVIATVVINNKMKPTTSKATAAAVTSASNSTTNSTNFSLTNTVPSVTSSGLYLKDGKTWNTQVYYQPVNSTNIMYRMSLVNGSAGDENFEQARNISLSYTPRGGSPMSAVASTDATGVVYLNIFYITTDNSIAQATLACPVNSNKCRTTGNLVISKGAQALHPQSGLAAVNVNYAQDWRIYYHNSNRNIVELAGNSSGFNAGVTIYSGTTLTGTYLTAVNVEKKMNNINVFFVDHDSKGLFYTQFTDSWQTALPVTSAVVTNWNPTSRLASAYTSTLNEMRVYYVGTDNRISEYVGYNATSTKTDWEQQPGTATTWSASTNTTQDITAIAYLDQVRWFQYDKGTGLVEAALDDVSWVENRVL